MKRNPQSDRKVVGARFAEVFAHLDFITAYARRRGARDPDGIAAEAMAIARLRLADVPTADARPWLIVTGPGQHGRRLIERPRAARSIRSMSSSIVRHSGGISWLEPGAMKRASHAVVDQGRVWLIDPFEDAAALAAVAELGQVAAVIQLLDRHRRDGETIARRLGVPLLQMPAAVPDSPFEVVEVISLPKWKEIALWWPAQKTLTVSEAVGTAPLFALGRVAGVHPLLRALPPRQALGRYLPDVLLVGHGAPVLSDAAGALTAALQNARRDIPRLVLSIPTALRDR